ncbi:SCO3374 family protein [Streptomyces sp. MS06]|uniref:SCO3374 family protein n=1 Tax=Streptomyces sp. MS06 TaxID=3385974 RepID=UPI0039A18E86
MVGPVTPRPVVPLPRRAPGSGGRAGGQSGGQARRWYEDALGWPTLPGEPLRLRVGPRFDVLDVPAEAGRAALRHLAPGSPVALHGGRMMLLVAAGSAEEVPGLLDWLQWGGLPLDVLALGEGAELRAPLPPGREPTAATDHGTAEECRSADRGAVEECGEAGDRGAAEERRTGAAGDGPVLLPPDRRPGPARRAEPPQGAAVWLRPPVPGCGAGASLPTLSALGAGAGTPDLVRLVDTVATQCHRIRLRRDRAQPLAFS